MENNKNKRTIQEEIKGNVKAPVMIISSGKVVGKDGEQWKEVRDNRVKNAKQDEVQVGIGKKIVLTNNVVVQQVQTNNKFAILELEEGQKEADDQLALVEEVNENQSLKPTPKSTGKLNPVDAVYIPASTGNRSSKGVTNANPNEVRKEEAKEKESTAHWVNRTFGNNRVTTD